MFARVRFDFHPSRLHALSCFPSKPFVSPAYKINVRNSFVSPTYAKTGGVHPAQKCRRADILDFSPDISHFFTFSSHTWHRRLVAGHLFIHLPFTILLPGLHPRFSRTCHIDSRTGVPHKHHAGRDLSVYCSLLPLPSAQGDRF